LVLPLNFLSHFGYGPKTIPAYQTIDQKNNFRRIQSTLRGANPFGAYLILVITALVARYKKGQTPVFVIVGSLVALAFTNSRSAWLGLIESLGFYFAVTYRQFV